MSNEIRVPNIGNFDTVEIIEVHINVGDTIQKEAALITVESEKASMDIPSEFDGEVQSLEVKIGDMISEGDLILTMDIKESVDSKPEIAPQPVKEEKPPVPKAEPEIVKAKVPEESKETEAVISFSGAHASPAIRKLARELGVNLNLVTGSARKGRITKSDVQLFVKKQLKEPQQTSQGFNLPEMPKIDFGKIGPIELKPLSRIQKKSATNLHRNWITIPHVTQFEDVDITETELFRKKQKVLVEKDGIKLTMLPFIMKAVAYCLKQFPAVNASLDSSQNQLILKKYYHIGLAVDTEYGLVVVVVKDVDQKNILEIAKEVQFLAEKARNGKLTPDDTQGGTFTISNLGGIGGTGFTPIINAPEVAILGVSKAQFKPVYNGESFTPRQLMPISFSYDHRVIDGALAARFTTFFSNTLQDLRNLII